MTADNNDNIPSPIIAALLAWVLPGLGHWYLGRRNKALVFAIGILLLLITGAALGQWRVISFGDRVLLIGQILSGLPALLLGVVSGQVVAAQGPPNVVPDSYEMGVLYTLVAGLLNLLVIFDAYVQGAGQERAMLDARKPAAAKGGANA